MEGHESYNNRLIKQRSGIWTSLRDRDFEEEEIWDVLKDKKTSSSNTIKPNYMDSTIHVQRSVLSAAKMIPKPNTTSCSTEVVKVLQQQQQESSAPVNIPDWSKFNKKKSKKNLTSLWLDGHDDYDNDDGIDHANGGYSDDEEEEDEHDDKFRMPPHEIIARRLARTQISSFSVFEGVGRTLKGRDLSKVRNAVLIKTGFLESL